MFLIYYYVTYTLLFICEEFERNCEKMCWFELRIGLTFNTRCLHNARLTDFVLSNCQTYRYIGFSPIFNMFTRREN